MHLGHSSHDGLAVATAPAFAWLERAYQLKSPPLSNLRFLPGFDPLRADPRFQDLLRRMNFPQ